MGKHKYQRELDTVPIARVLSFLIIFFRTPRYAQPPPISTDQGENQGEKYREKITLLKIISWFLKKVFQFLFPSSGFQNTISLKEKKKKENICSDRKECG